MYGILGSLGRFGSRTPFGQLSPYQEEQGNLRDQMFATPEFQAFTQAGNAMQPTTEEQSQMNSYEQVLRQSMPFQELDTFRRTLDPTQEEQDNLQGLEDKFKGTDQYGAYEDFINKMSGGSNNVMGEYKIPIQQPNSPFQKYLQPQPMPQPQPIQPSDGSDQFNVPDAFDSITKAINQLPKELGDILSGMFEPQTALVPTQGGNQGWQQNYGAKALPAYSSIGSASGIQSFQQPTPLPG